MDAGIISAVVVISIFVVLAIYRVQVRLEALEHQINAQKHEIELLLSQVTKRKE